MPKPIAVSLFSGCGGFCEGIKLAGFDIKVAVEYDKYACETYRANFPDTPLFEGDIHNFLGRQAKDHRKRYKLNDIDLVFGGPPCQGYSQIGPRDLRDNRNELYLEYARVVTELKPRMFLLENVPNLLLMNKGHFRDAFLRHFAEIGYSNTIYLKVVAADFGVPQMRERVFFLGTRDDLNLNDDLKSLAQSLLNQLKTLEPVTVWQAIADMPSTVVPSGCVMPYPVISDPSSFMRMMRLDYSEGPYTEEWKQQLTDGLALHNHHTKEMLAKRTHLISFLKPGEKANSLPKEIWNGARPEKWRRLHPDLPSYTILAQMHRDLSEWVHPKLERWITVREAARLQSFHDGFVFKSSEWQMLKQIGNAVPPLLAYAAGQMALTILQAAQTGVTNHATPEKRVLNASSSRALRRQSEAAL